MAGILEAIQFILKSWQPTLCNNRHKGWVWIWTWKIDEFQFLTGQIGVYLYIPVIIQNTKSFTKDTYSLNLINGKIISTFVYSSKYIENKIFSHIWKPTLCSAWQWASLTFYFPGIEKQGAVLSVLEMIISFIHSIVSVLINSNWNYFHILFTFSRFTNPNFMDSDKQEEEWTQVALHTKKAQNFCHNVTHSHTLSCKILSWSCHGHG